MLEKYDMYGMPISTERWIELTENHDRHVGETYIKREDKLYRVSTVWLGLDHNFMGDGPPIIFETMAFGLGGEVVGPVFRYPTLKSALFGHGLMVKALRRAPRPHKVLIHKGGKP